jgi:hypothetical protein
MLCVAFNAFILRTLYASFMNQITVAIYSLAASEVLLKSNVLDTRLANDLLAFFFTLRALFICLSAIEANVVFEYCLDLMELKIFSTV